MPHHPYLASCILIQIGGDDSSNRHRTTLHSLHLLSRVNFRVYNNSQLEASEVERSLTGTITQQQRSINQ